MTPAEAERIVKAVISLWPQQRLEEHTPDAWYAAALRDVDFQDAAEALTNLVKVATFVSLAEILAEVRRIRELRIARRPINDPPAELADDEAAYRALVKEATKRLGDGDSGAARILAIGTGAAPTEEYDRARGRDRHPLRQAAKRVRCPWCKADIGSACTTAGGRRLDQIAHDARLVAAGLADWVEVADGVSRAVLRGQGTP